MLDSPSVIYRVSYPLTATPSRVCNSLPSCMASSKDPAGETGGSRTADTHAAPGKEAPSEAPSGSRSSVEDLLGRLNLEEEEDTGFVWEDEVNEPDEKAKWLAIVKVHTNRGFSPSALFAVMRSAWNSAQDVTWRKIEDNLFTIQFTCLGDWNKAMNQGPWVFRNQAVIIEEYNGFSNPRSMILDKITVWAQVLKLPDMLLKEPIIRGICKNMGEIKEIQIKLPVGYVGEFVRIQVRIDVNKKLTRFVSVTKDKHKEWYQVKYEKLPTFCHNGHLGHWHEECGDGVHDESKFAWGDFILVVGGRGLGRGRGGGRSFPGRAPSMGRGRGRMGEQNAAWEKQDDSGKSALIETNLGEGLTPGND